MRDEEVIELEDFAEFENEVGIDPFVALDRPLQVEGFLACEVYAGKHSVTLGLIFSNVPCITPFELADSWRLDVIANGQVLLSLVKCDRLHLGIIEQPCQTLSLARWPELRNWDHVYGKSDLSLSQN